MNLLDLIPYIKIYHNNIIQEGPSSIIENGLGLIIHPNTKISINFTIQCSQLIFEINNLDLSSVVIDIYSNDCLVNSISENNKLIIVNTLIIKSNQIDIYIKTSSENIIISNIYLDDYKEDYFIDTMNTHKIYFSKQYNSKQTAIVFVVNNSFLEYLKLFLETFKIKNNISQYSCYGFVPYTDNQAITYMEENHITPILIEPLNNINIPKSVVYIDIANICNAEYFMIVDLDMMVLGDLSILNNLITAIDSNTILICKEQGINSEISLRQSINIEQVIYPENDSFIYLKKYEEDMKKIKVTNSGLIFLDRKSILRVTNYYKQNLPYFSSWIEINTKQCEWSEQAIFNLSLSKNNIIFLKPTYNLQLNTQNDQVELLSNNYIYNQEDIQILHFNGKNKEKYHTYYEYAILNTKWNPYQSYIQSQDEYILQTFLSSYFSNDVDYNILELEDKLSIYTNNLDIIYKTNKMNNYIITSNKIISKLCNAKFVNDYLLYITQNNLKENMIVDVVLTPYEIKATINHIIANKCPYVFYIKISNDFKIQTVLHSYLDKVEIEYVDKITKKTYPNTFIKVKYKNEI